MLDYVTHRSEKSGFQKKKKKKKKKDFARHHHEIVHFWPHQKSPKKKKINYFKTSLSFGKLRKNYDKWGPSEKNQLM